MAAWNPRARSTAYTVLYMCYALLCAQRRLSQHCARACACDLKCVSSVRVRGCMGVSNSCEYSVQGNLIGHRVIAAELRRLQHGRVRLVFFDARRSIRLQHILAHALVHDRLVFAHTHGCHNLHTAVQGCPLVRARLFLAHLHMHTDAWKCKRCTNTTTPPQRMCTLCDDASRRGCLKTTQLRADACVQAPASTV